jgi:N-(5-amino-5-carboxypentanoyl)-L-cysteinyl-D-valine synthase
MVDTIFMFPPKYGGAETYFNNLVPKLNKNRIILFNNRYQYLLKNGIHSGQELTYESLADYYYKLVKSIQHNGVYNLLGWSFGGILAVETARLINNENIRINSLVIIDSYFGLGTQVVGLVSKQERIDDVYKPSDYYFTSRIPTFIIYKASKCIEMCENTLKLLSSFHLDKEVVEDLTKVSLIYSKTSANKLDLFLENMNNLSVIEMKYEDHFSWERNESILKHICSHFNKI